MVHSYKLFTALHVTTFKDPKTVMAGTTVSAVSAMTAMSEAAASNDPVEDVEDDAWMRDDPVQGDDNDDENDAKSVTVAGRVQGFKTPHGLVPSISPRPQLGTLSVVAVCTKK